MKSVKKFFFAFFALLMSFGLFSALTNAKADVVVHGHCHLIMVMCSM